MCRLFGFRSVLNGQVHSSLVDSDNALIEQSLRHPDGWGVAYYIHGTPHLVKSSHKAMDDQLFKKISGVVVSQTVLAHIRKATHGVVNTLNSHPFQYANWTFAHNGNISLFDDKKDLLLKEIDPELKHFILGSTDSEIIFYFILSYLNKENCLFGEKLSLRKMKPILQKANQNLISLIGELSEDCCRPTENNFLTYILTNGDILIAFNGGQPLNFCTYKQKCPDRDHCHYFAPQCEAPPGADQKVNHLILSSEELQGVNVWKKLNFKEFIGVDSDMTLERWKL